MSVKKKIPLNYVELENIDAHVRSINPIENTIRKQMPKLIDILLLDRTTSTDKKPKNIIWGNDNYKKYGVKKYGAVAQIKSELIIVNSENLIVPRSLKNRKLQKERTKSKAEIFTPTWVVKKQNDEVEKNYLEDDDLETYIKRTWLEITCGEAPYMATRYDMETGEIIPLAERVGFVDRKLERINKEIIDKAEWHRLAEWAYKSSYGFEWNGDSLFLARKNLLYTYRDYYFNKWGEEPTQGLFESIAIIISYNIFQMDGIKYIIPLSEKKEKVVEFQMSLFDLENESKEQWIIKPGRRVKIMNWSTNKMEFFDKGVK